MDRTLALLRSEEVSSCLRFVELTERSGHMAAAEAAEWRRRIMAWSAFLELAADVAPRDVELGHCGTAVAGNSPGFLAPAEERSS